MDIVVKEVVNKGIWEDFLLKCEEKTFLNSWNWGEFNKTMGNKVWRWGVFSDFNHLMGVSQIIKIRAKRGTFFHLPHSPNVDTNKKEHKEIILKTLLKNLKTLAKREKVDFIRVSPVWERNNDNIEIFKKLNFRMAPIHMHAELTWELDITPETETLLNNMRKTTRYLIRQAKKNNDVKIIESKDIDDIKEFNQIYQETSRRHHFVVFPFQYLKNEFSTFLSDNQIFLLLGKYKNEVVSSGIFILWQKTAFYHHGASILKYRKIPVSYLLIWEAIKKAKEMGCQRFNFWGIAPDDKPKHPWAGLSLFKKGFGGYKKEYVQTQDLPLSWRYWLIYIFEKLRRIKRRL